MNRRSQIAVTLLVAAVLVFLGAWLYRVFFPGPPPSTQPHLRAPGGHRPRVLVMNVSGLRPVGARAARLLKDLGYSVRLIPFPRETLETSVILDHRSAQLDLGRRLQGALKIPVVSYDPDPENPADATVVLGKDAVRLVLRP